VGGSLLVVPRVLPRLRAGVAGGRAAPGGEIDVDAELTDAQGQGLPGLVSAIMIDAHGGGTLAGLVNLDTRGDLCGQIGADSDRCDAAVEHSEPGGDATLRGDLGARERGTLAPAVDPAATMEKDMRDEFKRVVESLEGAVFESTTSADRLRDVRRRTAGGAWAFNPELLTLVTAAMDPKPQTPGGEPFSLADLLAIDPQVTFSNVARRITRLKLFRVLTAVRAFKRERQLDPDEPALSDPNALMRRLVRDERVDETLLLDPWGGTLRFVRSGAPPAPFLSIARGWQLVSPGPDGAIGTADDVHDPFERVLASGTPYAKAVEEDRIVDAKLDVEVGDETVSRWTTMFDELTGTRLGEGIDLSGVGEGGGGGTGSGFGSGHGRSGNGRVTSAVTTDVAFWSPPARTDANGHTRIKIPLGAIETTWRIALVGIPDRATPATATLDVPVALPLSARIDVGACWIAGDTLDALVMVRNRTEKPVRASVALAATEPAVLADARGKTREVDVPAGGSAAVPVRLRADRAGRPALLVVTRAPGLPEDVARHEWEVKPAAERIDLAHVQWAEGDIDLSPWLDPKPYEPLGPARLVLERGQDVALAAALESLDPDRLTTPAALADAVEVGARVHAWAVARDGDADATAARAEEIRRQAQGRLLVLDAQHKGTVGWSAGARAAAFGSLPGERRPSCPGESAFGNLATALDGLDAEPAPVGDSAMACWDAYVSEVVDRVEKSHDPSALARALLAFADRPHRAARAEEAAERLRAWANVKPRGAIALDAPFANDRAARATVFAALARAAVLRAGRHPAVSSERFLAWAAIQRDRSGGFGSPSATRAVVRAMIAASPPPFARSGDTPDTPRPGTKTVVSVVADGVARDVELSGSSAPTIVLEPRTRALRVETRGAVLLARLERPALRAWSQPPSDAALSPVHLDVVWPKARAHHVATLRVTTRQDLAHNATVDIDLPLPPGVALAEPVESVRQVQGVLSIRRALEASSLGTTIEIPLRFALPGKVTVPEGTARVAYEEAPRAIAPARPLVIE
jgi:hypothetical protein